MVLKSISAALALLRRIRLKIQLAKACMRLMKRCKLKKDPSLEGRMFSPLHKESYTRSVDVLRDFALGCPWNAKAEWEPC